MGRCGREPAPCGLPVADRRWFLPQERGGHPRIEPDSWKDAVSAIRRFESFRPSTQSGLPLTFLLRRDTGYHTCPLGADIAAAARIPFPAHRHSVVAAHRRVAAERDNNTDLGP